MPDNSLDISIRTTVELEELRRLEDQLQRQIIQAKTLGKEYASLEGKLAGVRGQLAGMSQSVQQTSGSMEMGGRRAFMLTNNFVRMGETGTASFHQLAHEAILFNHTMAAGGLSGSVVFAGVAASALFAGYQISKINELSKETDENWKAAGQAAQGYLKNFLIGIGVMDAPHIRQVIDLKLDGQDFVKGEVDRLKAYVEQITHTQTPAERGFAFAKEDNATINSIGNESKSISDRINAIESLKDKYRSESENDKLIQAMGTAGSTPSEALAELRKQYDALKAKQDIAKGNAGIMERAGIDDALAFERRQKNQPGFIAAEKQSGLARIEADRSNRLSSGQPMTAEEEAKAKQAVEEKANAATRLLEVEKLQYEAQGKNTTALQDLESKKKNWAAEDIARQTSNATAIETANRKDVETALGRKTDELEAQKMRAERLAASAREMQNYSAEQSALDDRYNAERKILEVKVDENKADGKAVAMLREQITALDSANQLRKSGIKDRLALIAKEQAFAFGGLTTGEQTQQQQDWQRRRLHELLPFGTSGKDLDPNKAGEAMKLIEQMRQDNPLQAREFSHRYFGGRTPTVTDFETETKRLQSTGAGLGGGQDRMMDSLVNFFNRAGGDGINVTVKNPDAIGARAT